ncbi:T9SS type A sorting domain-containing protein [Flavobacterium sp. CF136]|uniref:T9SS type A sorting domain-containing protein n=1 Tax=Flavobacterium sp. (strain CF136) TaxID=1144313 RepID=UPI00027152EB|nr:T9SS type A sorting domain-containing protein [Flavobacterium sp. CF136]EJL60977.1 Por secretion system C-terminal sorting domain-containing protein [Flavobacterium sp. CF136]
MKKNYLYVILLLLSNLLAIGQKVTLTPTLVNGVGYSGGSINLASVPTSTISLSVKVEVPSTAAVGDQGTIKIYFSKGNALGSNIANGGDGGALYFGGGKIATRSFVINLSWGDFLTSGGFIFAEYKSGTSYISSNIAVIKNATMTSGTNINPPADAPDPNKIVNTLCCDQTIRLGDKPAPITGSQYLNPYKYLPYGIESYWETSGNQPLPLEDTNKILNIDYVTEPGDFNITRWLGYDYQYGYEFTNKSNTITIKVVPSPITSNEISIKNVPVTEDFVEISNTNPKSIVGSRSNNLVNLNILQNPLHIAQRGDNLVDIERYEWEYTKTNISLGGLKDWKTIEGENSSTLGFFNPSDMTNNEDNYYLVRRIAIYQNIKRVSNSVKILLRTARNNNNICCDQILNIPSAGIIESPSTLIGSTPFIDNTTITGTNLMYTLSYQWQSQSVTNNSVYGNWLDISGATSKDYLPLPLNFVANPRGSLIIQTTYNYRRLATINYQVISNGQLVKGNTKSYSNEVSLVSSNSTYTSPILTVYPNPASSIINIEYKGTDYILANTQINIVNAMGAIVSSNNFSTINPNLISINISNLTLGTYFINIQTGGNRNTQLTFIKNN